MKRQGRKKAKGERGQGVTRRRVSRPRSKGRSRRRNHESAVLALAFISRASAPRPGEIPGRIPQLKRGKGGGRGEPVRLSNSFGLSSVIPAREFTASNFILPVNSAGYVSPGLSIRPLRVSRGEDSTPSGRFSSGFPHPRTAARVCSTQMQSRGRIAIRGCEPCGAPSSLRIGIAISREFDRSKEQMLITPNCPIVGISSSRVIDDTAHLKCAT